MSTEFITSPGISLRALRQFDHKGVTATEETPDSLVLTDGSNFLVAYAESDEDAPCYVRKAGSGDPTAILEAISDLFHVRVVSEYDDDWPKLIAAIVRSKKQRAHPPCPRCGATSVARILYGLPDYSARLRADMAAGRTVLGGCMTTSRSPSWRCHACRHEWGRRR